MKRYAVIANKDYEVHVDAINDHMAIAKALEMYRADGFMDQIESLKIHEINAS